MRQTLILVILFFHYNYSLSQCIDGNCNQGNGVLISNNIITKYVGEFKNGQFHGNGILYKIEYEKVNSDLYSKKEILVFDGVFENGNKKKGKAYDENEIIIYDGEFAVIGDYLMRHGEGISYIDKKRNTKVYLKMGSLIKERLMMRMKLLFMMGNLQ